MTIELATRNGEWLVSPRDTMATFVDAVDVGDRKYAYRELYAAVRNAVQRDDWDDALGAALRLRKYAHAAADWEGEKLAALLTSFAFIALNRYREASQSLSLAFFGEVAPLGMWHGALAHTVRSIVAEAQGNTAVSVARMQDALDYLDRLADQVTQHHMCYGQCTPARRAAQRLLCNTDHIRTRETLRDALREVIGRLAVMA